MGIPPGAGHSCWALEQVCSFGGAPARVYLHLRRSSGTGLSGSGSANQFFAPPLQLAFVGAESWLDLDLDLDLELELESPLGATERPVAECLKT